METRKNNYLMNECYTSTSALTLPPPSIFRYLITQHSIDNNFKSVVIKSLMLICDVSIIKLELIFRKYYNGM